MSGAQFLLNELRQKTAMIAELIDENEALSTKLNEVVEALTPKQREKLGLDQSD